METKALTQKVIIWCHIHMIIHRLLIGPASLSVLFWLSCYVAGHCSAVAPQSGAKQFFYCTVYYITLNSNCEAQRPSKKLEKELRKIEVKNNAQVI